MTARPDAVDEIDGQRFVVYRHSANELPDERDGLVVHDHLTQIACHSRLEHPRTVDQAGPCQRWC